MPKWRHLKKLAENLALLAWYAVAVMGLSGQLRFFCQDETRIGLKTISGARSLPKASSPKAKCSGSSRPLISTGGRAEYWRALLL
jgi:hypothetical protein